MFLYQRGVPLSDNDLICCSITTQRIDIRSVTLRSGRSRIWFKSSPNSAYTTYNYKRANWPLFRSSLDLALDPHPSIRNSTELDLAITTFTQSVLQAATQAIPVHAVKRNYLTLPPTLLYLWKLKNYYRRRYQRIRSPLLYYLSQLFARVFSTYFTRLRNSKWSSFLAPYTHRFTNSGKSPNISQNPQHPCPPQPTRVYKFVTPNAKQRFSCNSSSAPIISPSIWALLTTPQ